MDNDKVLLIDDDDVFRVLLRIRLEKLGYEVVEAKLPDDGIEAAKREQPDIVILDLYMPGMDGYEVARILRANERTRDIPIVVVTSATDDRFRKKSMDWGADAHVKKRELAAGDENAADFEARIRKDQMELSELRSTLQELLRSREL